MGQEETDTLRVTELDLAEEGACVGESMLNYKKGI